MFCYVDNEALRREVICILMQPAFFRTIFALNSLNQWSTVPNWKEVLNPAHFREYENNWKLDGEQLTFENALACVQKK